MTKEELREICKKPFNISVISVLKKAGFTIKCDTGLVCGHVGGIIDNRTYQGVKKLSPIHNLPFHIPGLSRRKKK